MKSSGQIMQELGFNKNASDSAKAAFLKHLFKAATGCEVQTPSFETKISKAPPAMQLSFDLDTASYQEAI
ncbi:MAG: hypothetical protein K0R29_502 [Pseudobdellovibrio sp.]|jgi:hypothetical protein|nr:hypothetical protein [Pseudobdellovibrio sp.]